MDLSKLSKINELVTLNTLRKPKIVINPRGNYSLNSKKNYNDEDELSADIVIDSVEWKIPRSEQQFVEKLAKDTNLDNETKIILLFEELAKKYIYDDNILSYIKKLDDDTYDLPDWYGRVTDEEWEKNREKHNKKVCYEVSRILAKSISEVFKDNKDYSTCVLWDQARTHYYGALTSDNYTLTLDLDDFNNIKDLTRVKTGLTIEGIKILEDPNNIFAKALNSYNKTKEKHAIRAVNIEVDKIQNSKKDDKQKDDEDIVYLNYVLQVLNEEYDLDSQGLFEYMKEIVDITIGPKNREKVWKKIETKGKDTIYTCCLVLNSNEKKYIIDVVEKELREFDEKEFEKEVPEFIPFKSLRRDWDDQYDGRI